MELFYFFGILFVKGILGLLGVCMVEFIGEERVE